MRLKFLIFTVLLSIIVIQSVSVYAVGEQTLFYNLVVGGSGADYPWSMEPLPDGGFVIVSTTQSFGSPHSGTYDGSLWLLMIYKNGSIGSSMVVEPPSPSIYYDSALLPDNSIVAVGTTGDYSKAVITRVYLNGSVVFYKDVSPNSDAYYPHLTSVAYYDGLIFAIGGFWNTTLSRPIIWVLVLDLDGNIVESIGYDPGSPFYYPTPFSVVLFNNTLYLAGYGYTNPSLIMALNISTWDVELAYMVGNSSRDNIFGMTLADDKLVIAGSTDDYGGEYAFVAAIYPNGTLAWGKALGSAGIERFFGLYYDGEYIYASGWSQVNYTSYKNDTLIAKFNASSGNMEWYRIIGGERDDWAYRIYVDQFKYIYVIGGIGNTTSSDDVILLKLFPNGWIPNCNLIRDEILDVEDYDPDISSISPILYNYTSTTSATTYTTPSTQASPAIYKVCSCVVGGTILSFNSSVSYIFAIGAAGILAIVLFITKRVMALH